MSPHSKCSVAQSTGRYLIQYGGQGVEDAYANLTHVRVINESKCNKIEGFEYIDKPFSFI